MNAILFFAVFPLYGKMSGDISPTCQGLRLQCEEHRVPRRGELSSAPTGGSPQVRKPTSICSLVKWTLSMGGYECLDDNITMFTNIFVLKLTTMLLIRLVYR